MKLLITLIMTLNLYAITVGEIPKHITIDEDRGGLISDESIWDSATIRDKVIVMFYVDPDEKDINSHFSKKLKAQNYDKSRFGSIAIINLAATWKPNFILEGILKDKQIEFPDTLYVKDKKSVLVKEWDLEDDASNILIFSSYGELLFYRSGAMDEADIIKALKLSFRDFFTKKMLKYSIAPFILTIILMYILFFTVAGIGVEHLSEMGQVHIQTSDTTIQNGVPHTESFSTILEGNAIIQFLMSYAITSWIATFLIYAIGSFFILYASIFMAIIVIGFLTPFVLKELQRRHYKNVEMIGYSNPIFSILLLLRWAIIMLFLFILLIPFYFIPLVNIIAFNLPLYYFFHKMITFDISSNISTKEEYKKIKYFHSGKIRLRTLALYLISLVPFAIFFGAIFYVIYLGHTYFIEIKKIR